MRTRPTVLLGLLLVAACGGDAAGPPPAAAPARSGALLEAGERDPRIAAETTRLNEWFDSRYEEQLDFSPIRKTSLGRKDDYDQLDDLSEAAQDAQFEWRRETVRDLERSFDRALLTPEAQVSYDLWLYALEEAESWLPFRRRGYLFTQMGGMHTSLPQILINFHRVDEDADMEAYVARIGAAGRAIAQMLERAQLAAAEGVRPPRFAYEGVLEQARAVVTGVPFGGDGDAPLWAYSVEKLVFTAVLAAGS